MANKVFAVPVVFYIEASNYKRALDFVTEWADDLSESPAHMEEVEVPSHYETDDETGERVLRLHPETEAADFESDEDEDEDDEDSGDEEEAYQGADDEE